MAPGIRPAARGRDDHKRTLTPRQAIADGADYLVVGRPITQSPAPRQAAQSISADIQAALDRDGLARGFHHDQA